ncbi:hypothetical protein ACFQ1S_42460, partial [Kibdelosporangium lantanae]
MWVTPYGHGVRTLLDVRTWLLVVAMLMVTVGGSIGESYPLQPDDQVFQGHPVPATPWPAFLLVAAATIALA